MLQMIWVNVGLFEQKLDQRPFEHKAGRQQTETSH